MAQYDMIWGSDDLQENCIFEAATGKTVISYGELAQMNLSTWDLMGMDDEQLDRWVEAHIPH